MAKNMLEQLKQNEKPFGLMSAEMQEKAREIGKPFFLFWDGDKWTARGVCAVFGDEYAYCLRADYKDEPKIVECAIFASGVQLMYAGPSGPTGIHKACKDPDFIGFKFEDGSWYEVPIKPVNRSDSLPGRNITLDDIVSGSIRVLHATHVLFRRPK